jgi:hypothetical protein
MYMAPPKERDISTEAGRGVIQRYTLYITERKKERNKEQGMYKIPRRIC